MTNSLATSPPDARIVAIAAAGACAFLLWLALGVVARRIVAAAVAAGGLLAGTAFAQEPIDPAGPFERPVPAPGVVVVLRGDTLWGIAARALGPGATPARTAATWPRWYATNRAVVGPDPGLIRPGQRLRPPGAPR